MIGVVVVTHGRLADEFLAATQTIVGALAQMDAVALDPSLGPEEARSLIAHAIRRVDDGDGVLILTDMFGGTPSNLSLSFLDEASTEVVTGVNLPMLIKVAVGREGRTLRDLAKFIQEYGQKNISVASDILLKRVERARGT